MAQSWGFSSVPGVISSSGLGSSSQFCTECSLNSVASALGVVSLHGHQAISFHLPYPRQGQLCPDLLFLIENLLWDWDQPELQDPGTFPVPQGHSMLQELCSVWAMRVSTPGRNTLYNARKSSGSSKPSSSLSHICLDGHRQVVHEDNSMNFPRLFLKVSTRPLSIPTSKLEKGAIDKEINTYVHTKYECLPPYFICVLFGGVGTICRWSFQNRVLFLCLPFSHVNSMRLCSVNFCEAAIHSQSVLFIFTHFSRCYIRKIPWSIFTSLNVFRGLTPFLTPNFSKVE